MKNNLNKLFTYLNDSEVQKKLKRLNILISLIAIFYIYQLIEKNLFTTNFNFQVNFLEVGILVITYFVVGITWVKFSNKNAKIVRRDVFFDWAYSNIGKYVPGGFGIVSIRLNQSSEEKNSKRILFGLLEEQFLVPLLSLPILIVSTYILDETGLILFIIFFQVIFIFLFKKIYFQNSRLENNSLLNYSSYLLTSILLTNLVTILIFYNLGFDDYLHQAIYYLIASYTALIFVGVPSGIGIREGIFFLLSDISFNFSQQLDALIYIRVLYLIVDTLFGLIGFIYKNKSSN
tara:strand:- start:174 stop:1043 length:870 start_codon:yes stop_codon:yes gene_type:complete